VAIPSRLTLPLLGGKFFAHLAESITDREKNVRIHLAASLAQDMVGAN
jgi:hypothetical protein